MGEVFAHRYELLDPIAEGGMGTVWRVHDHQQRVVRAAKLLRHSDAGSLLRFVREQSLRIDHPHVVTPLSWHGEDDRVLFTMPLMRGGSVSSLVGDWGALPENWVLVLLDQALSALEAVHDRGVVHRDVKSANLLLEPTGAARPHLRLSDFGIAISRDEPRLTTGPGSLGTPGYIAPEQRAGAHPDPRQDIYSLATVGLEMLIGHPPPFATDELPPTPLGGLLVEAGNPDPARRPATAAVFRQRIQPWLLPEWHPGDIEVLDQFDLSEPAGGDAPPAVVATARSPGSTRSYQSPRTGAVAQQGSAQPSGVLAPSSLLAIGLLMLLGLALLAVSVVLLAG